MLLSQHTESLIPTIKESSIPEEANTLNYLTLLQNILKGITDIIGVYKPDRTIMFYNQAGYDFYKKTPQEINGKKCYETLGRRSCCTVCTAEKSIKSKSIVRLEKYIPELDRYMDCCCNPILDDAGNIILIVEQLRDITENKILENILKESEEKYRRIVDLSPEAMIITLEGIIVLANKETSKIYGVDHNQIIGQNITNFIKPEYFQTINKRMHQILNKQVNSTTFDYEIFNYDKSIISLEVTSKFLKYQGKPAIQSVLRNITEKKTELTKAANMQKQSLQKDFPLPNKVKVEAVFVAARTVSGDFYHLHQINENLLIGILVDVSGKGITAALNVSALNVLFHETVLNCHDPLKIVKDLNLKVSSYLNETYIAVCCFSFDFKGKIAKIVGGGIGQFIVIDSNKEIKIKTVPGAFLGMFENSIFEEEIIPFKSGNSFYFYTDGLDFIFDDGITRTMFTKPNTIGDLYTYLNDKSSDIEGLKDDSTLLKLEIK